jgi:DNA-binding transcriptional ArsR family regulator
MAEGRTQSSAEASASDRRLADLIGGYQASAAIGALARLGVADALAEGPATSAELAARLGAHQDALTRLLEVTLDIGLFTLDDDGRYRLTALGDLLRTDTPGSLRRYAIVSTEDWRWYAYAHLAHTLQSGESGFVAAHGSGLWDYLATHPVAAASFEASMARIGAARDQAIIATVDFSRFRSLVDVGGGHGGFLRALLVAYPDLRGVLFDLPSVIEGAREEPRQVGLAERCELIAGDFREAVPPGGDAYLLSWILHDWDDPAARGILKRCREAMAKGTTLFVVEMIVPEEDRPEADALRRLVKQADLEMLAVVGGRERTASEFQGLLTAAGFAVTQTLPLKGLPWSVIEAEAV